MQMQLDWNSSELRELMDYMATEVTQNVSSRVVKPAITRASKVLIQAMRSNIRANGSVRSGALAESIDAKVLVFRNGNVSGMVGPKRGFSRPHQYWLGKDPMPMRISKPTMYAHLVELGTRPHWQPRLRYMHPGVGPDRGGPRKNSQSPKDYNFMRKAMHQVQDLVTQTLVSEMRDRLERIEH